MNREHFSARTTFFDSGGPIKTRQRLPNLSVEIFICFETGEKMTFACGGERQDRFVLQHLSVRFGGVENDRDQILERAVRESKLASARAGEENQAAGLLFDQAAN